MSLFPGDRRNEGLKRGADKLSSAAKDEAERKRFAGRANGFAPNEPEPYGAEGVGTGQMSDAHGIENAGRRLPDGWEVVLGEEMTDHTLKRPKWATAKFYVLDSSTNVVGKGGETQQAAIDAAYDVSLEGSRQQFKNAEPMSRVLKHVWVRDPESAPQGKPGSGRISCPCGKAPVSVYADGKDVECPCGRKYDSRGNVLHDLENDGGAVPSSSTGFQSGEKTTTAHRAEELENAEKCPECGHSLPHAKQGCQYRNPQLPGVCMCGYGCDTSGDITNKLPNERANAGTARGAERYSGKGRRNVDPKANQLARIKQDIADAKPGLKLWVNLKSGDRKTMTKEEATRLDLATVASVDVAQGVENADDDGPKCVHCGHQIKWHDGPPGGCTRTVNGSQRCECTKERRADSRFNAEEKCRFGGGKCDKPRAIDSSYCVEHQAQVEKEVFGGVKNAGGVKQGPQKDWWFVDLLGKETQVTTSATDSEDRARRIAADHTGVDPHNFKLVKTLSNATTDAERWDATATGTRFEKLKNWGYPEKKAESEAVLNWAQLPAYTKDLIAKSHKENSVENAMPLSGSTCPDCERGKLRLVVSKSSDGRERYKCDVCAATFSEKSGERENSGSHQVIDSSLHCMKGSCDKYGCSCDCPKCFEAIFGVKPGIETTAAHAPKKLSNSGHLDAPDWELTDETARIGWLDAAGLDVSMAKSRWPELSEDAKVALQKAWDYSASQNNGNAAAAAAKGLRADSGELVEPLLNAKGDKCPSCGGTETFEFKGAHGDNMSCSVCDRTWDSTRKNASTSCKYCGKPYPDGRVSAMCDSCLGKNKEYTDAERSGDKKRMAEIAAEFKRLGHGLNNAESLVRKTWYFDAMVITTGTDHLMQGQVEAFDEADAKKQVEEKALKSGAKGVRSCKVLKAYKDDPRENTLDAIPKNPADVKASDTSKASAARGKVLLADAAVKKIGDRMKELRRNLASQTDSASRRGVEEQLNGAGAELAQKTQEADAAKTELRNIDDGGEMQAITEGGDSLENSTLNKMACPACKSSNTIKTMDSHGGRFQVGSSKPTDAWECNDCDNLWMTDPMNGNKILTNAGGYPLSHFRRPESKERADSQGIEDVEDEDLTPGGLAAKLAALEEGHGDEALIASIKKKLGRANANQEKPCPKGGAHDWKYYDGALGYETEKCTKCNLDWNDQPANEKVRRNAEMKNATRAEVKAHDKKLEAARVAMDAPVAKMRALEDKYGIGPDKRTKRGEDPTSGPADYVQAAKEAARLEREYDKLFAARPVEFDNAAPRLNSYTFADNVGAEEKVEAKNEDEAWSLLSARMNGTSKNLMCSMGVHLKNATKTAKIEPYRNGGFVLTIYAGGGKELYTAHAPSREELEKEAKEQGAVLEVKNADAPAAPPEPKAEEPESKPASKPEASVTVDSDEGSTKQGESMENSKEVGLKRGANKYGTEKPRVTTRQNAKQQEYNVSLNNNQLAPVFLDENIMLENVRDFLVKSEGYDSRIQVKKA